MNCISIGDMIITIYKPQENVLLASIL